MLIKEKKISNFSNLFLTKLGMNRKDSKLVSKLLVKSDMSQHFSHGVIRLVQYYNMVKNKIYRIKGKPKIKIKGKFMVIDGQRSFGQITMNHACQKIKDLRNDIQIVSVSNCGHIGRLSDYAEFLSKSGYVNLIFCNGGGPNTSIYPSAERIVGTNPFSFGIQINKKKTLIIDFATSLLAEGKINIAKLNKKKIKIKPIISKNGIYTNNPSELYSGGSLRTFGGIKGSAFSLVNEILGGLLISSNNPINKNYLDGNNCLIICIKKKLFNYNNSFTKQFLKIETKIKKSRKIKILNNKKTYLPGEIELKNFLNSKKKGIIYNNSIVKKLNFFAKNKLNIPQKNLL